MVVAVAKNLPNVYFHCSSYIEERLFMYFIRRDTTSSKFFHVNMATYTAQTTATTEMVTIAGISIACQLSISSNLNIIQKKISNCIIVPCHAKATRTFKRMPLLYHSTSSAVVSMTTLSAYFSSIFFGSSTAPSGCSG